MFADLPENIKKTVLFHLHKNEFTQAKAIHDKWIALHAEALAEKHQLAIEAAPSRFVRIVRFFKELKFTHVMVEFISVLISLIATGLFHMMVSLAHLHHVYMVIAAMFSHIVSWFSSSMIMSPLKKMIPALPKRSLIMQSLHKLKSIF